MLHSVNDAPLLPARPYACMVSADTKTPPEPTAPASSDDEDDEIDPPNPGDPGPPILRPDKPEQYGDPRVKS